MVIVNYISDENGYRPEITYAQPPSNVRFLDVPVPLTSHDEILPYHDHEIKTPSPAYTQSVVITAADSPDYHPQPVNYNQNSIRTFYPTYSGAHQDQFAPYYNSGYGKIVQPVNYAGSTVLPHSTYPSKRILPYYHPNSGYPVYIY